MAEWPRLTKYQRDMLLRFDRAKYNDMHRGTRDYRTFARLFHEGMIDGGPAGWYSLTQRGKDYVRFVLRESQPKVSQEEK